MWIVDGYTTSNSYPNSERVNLNSVTSDAQTTVGGTVVAQPQDDINYIRNSVKAVVDAYDGTVRLFAWDETDPVLQTWRKAFPDVVEPKTEIPEDLLDHLRYPQDLFKVQRQILTNYHVTDPGTWYSNSNLWEVPNDPVVASAQTKESPFYLSVKWPGDEQPDLLPDHLLRPPGPAEPGLVHGRQRRRQQPGVRPDAHPDHVGHLPDRRPRAELQRDDHQRDGGRAAATVPQPGRGDRDQFGNLLTLPVGGGLLYVTPVYTQRQGSTGSYPALRFVIVRFGQEVGIGDTLQQALDQVFEGNSGAPPTEGEPPGEETPPPGGNPDNPAATKALTEAEAAFVAADKALTAGDLATYQAKIKKAEAAVERALQALNR